MMKNAVIFGIFFSPEKTLIRLFAILGPLRGKLENRLSFVAYTGLLELFVIILAKTIEINPVREKGLPLGAPEDCLPSGPPVSLPAASAECGVKGEKFTAEGAEKDKD